MRVDCNGKRGTDPAFVEKDKRYPRTIMATACLPWDENFRLEEPLFRAQIRRMTAAGICSIYLFGTAGEGYAVDDEQFMQIVQIFAGEMNAPGLLPMIGIISLSLPHILRRIEWCRESGLRDFQISFPSWGTLSDREADAFFDAVLNRFPDCRFMHYNNGLRSRKLLSPGDYDRLWSRYPNLAAVKYPGLCESSDFSGSLDHPIRFFPLEGGYGPMSRLSACGLLISYLNLNYEIAWEYFHAGVNGDRQTLSCILSDIDKVADVFRRTLPMDRMDGTYDKLFIKIAIPDFPHRLYPPYEGIDDRQFEVFRERLRRAVPHWFGDGPVYGACREGE